MKALTICQPYAELIARGEKLIENRTWFTPYRGPLIIHAGKSRDWLNGEEWEHALPFGAIVAVADLYACVRYSALSPLKQLNEHASGPWCWLLRDIRRIAPIPYRGAQGLFDIPDSVVAAVQEMI